MFFYYYFHNYLHEVFDQHETSTVCFKHAFKINMYKISDLFLKKIKCATICVKTVKSWLYQWKDIIYAEFEWAIYFWIKNNFLSSLSKILVIMPLQNLKLAPKRPSQGQYITIIFSEKISSANDGLFVINGLSYLWMKILMVNVQLTCTFLYTTKGINRIWHTQKKDQNQ